MRQEMYGPAASRMEKLLIDQFIICWLLAQSANMQQLPTSDTSIPVGRFVLQQPRVRPTATRCGPICFADVPQARAAETQTARSNGAVFAAARRRHRT